MSRDGVWIFGYGSLVWRPGFAHRARRPAWVRGLRRRFWQGSTDHRGVPGKPGRVVTLVEESDAHCLGMAYLVSLDDVDAVIAQLDHREQGGYARVEAELHFGDRAEPARGEGLLYLATPDNPNYLGPAPLDAIARQVLDSTGPSGPNLEYVTRLADALRTLGPHLTPATEEALALSDRVSLLSRDASGRAS